MIHMSELINRDNPPKKIYRDVRKRYSDRATDADIVIALAIENSILTGKNSYLQAENDNLRRMYTELMEKYKEVKNGRI